MSSGKSTTSKVSDKVQQVAAEDFNQAKKIANDAVRSGAYLYPFKVCFVDGNPQSSRD